LDANPVDFIVWRNDVDVRAVGTGHDGLRRHSHDVLQHRYDQLHANELTRPQKFVGIGKRGLHQGRASIRINLVVDDCELALVEQFSVLRKSIDF
jgi:hypothetical protein